MIDIKDESFWKSFKELYLVVDNDGELLKLCGCSAEEDVIFETISLDYFDIEEC